MGVVGILGEILNGFVGKDVRLIIDMVADAFGDFGDLKDLSICGLYLL